MSPTFLLKMIDENVCSFYTLGANDAYIKSWYLYSSNNRMKGKIHMVNIPHTSVFSNNINYFKIIRTFHFHHWILIFCSEWILRLSFLFILDAWLFSSHLPLCIFATLCPMCQGRSLHRRLLPEEVGLFQRTV